MYDMLGWLAQEEGIDWSHQLSAGWPYSAFAPPSRISKGMDSVTQLATRRIWYGQPGAAWPGG